MIRTLIFIIYDVLFNKAKVIKHYNQLKKSQYYSYDKLKMLQFERFKILWQHAIKNIPYYEKIAKENNLTEINSIEDIQFIPILTKDIVRKEFDNLIAKNLSPNRFINNSTSGTSGEAFYFYSDSSSSDIHKALEIRKYKMMGVNIFDRELIIWGSAFDIKKTNSKRATKLKSWYHNRKIVSGYNLSDEGIWNIYVTLCKYKPLIIKSYPSILMTICDYFEKNGLNYYPQVIHIGGEKLYDFQKERIKHIFNCPVYDFYGARDTCNIAMHCCNNRALHVNMESVLFEVVNEHNKLISEGEGDVIVTDLCNYVMPLIRYRIGDRAKISNQIMCECGRGLQLIDEVIGRSFDIIEFDNGNRVGGTFWTFLMKSKKEIDKFQVIIYNKNNIVIKYVSNKTNIDFTYYIDKIHHYSGNNVVITFEKVDEIPLTNNGKFQFVIKNK